MKLDHFLTPYTKINSKWMKDLNVRQETIKILQEKTGSNFWPQLQQLLTWHVSGGKGNKSKNEPLGPHEDKKLLHNKGNNKTKRQLMEWEKIIANDKSDKGLLSKIYKELTKLNTWKTNNPVKKWAKDMNRHFSKKTSRWLTDTWKDAQHHSSSGKYKSKPHWDTTCRIFLW